jgi:3-hydroxyisobutyrate dehydrogenase-like beta-hydroxyacid dehydrogenase
VTDAAIACQRGARTAAASPQDAVRDARVVITMLPTADVVNSVVFTAAAAAFADGAVSLPAGSPRRLTPSGHDKVDFTGAVHGPV